MAGRAELVRCRVASAWSRLRTGGGTPALAANDLCALFPVHYDGGAYDSNIRELVFSVTYEVRLVQPGRP